MRAYRLVAVITLSSLVFLLSLKTSIAVSNIGNPIQPQVAGATTENYQKTGSPLIDLVNNARVAEGLRPLSIEGDLTKVSQMRANDMIEKQYYSHKAPDGSDYTSLLTSRNSFSCEDLDLSSSSDDEQIFNDWMGSPSHRACLLDPRAVYVGTFTSVFADYGTNTNRSYISVIVLKN